MRRVIPLALLLAAITGCSGGKTRGECERECRKEGMPFSGKITRTETVAEDGSIHFTEVCRCNVEGVL